MQPAKSIEFCDMGLNPAYLADEIPLPMSNLASLQNFVSCLPIIRSMSLDSRSMHIDERGILECFESCEYCYPTIDIATKKNQSFILSCERCNPNPWRKTKKERRPPLVDHRHNPAAVDANLLPCRLGHVEMLARWVAPPTVVIGKCIVWRAKVGGGDGHRHAFFAPPGVRLVIAHDLVALPACSPIIEQGRAQSCGSGPISRRVQVTVAACSTYKRSTSRFQSPVIRTNKIMTCIKKRSYGGG